ncbi:MAG TPA: protein kinase [Polyangiaceae bacterium]|nr:protein kinase [Polyangiaceae bacterium]
MSEQGRGTAEGRKSKRRVSDGLGNLAGSKGMSVGAYRLVDLVGAGGMGEVWLARHELLGRLAAVKLIRPDAALLFPSEGETLKRFEREARATSALRSPHTIAIYDFGTVGERGFYYAMELLLGLSLDVLVERFGEVSPARAIHLLRGACESLSEAHQRGLIHRDIKPANIFTCSMGLARDFVKVLDFGLVKHVVSDGSTSLTIEGAIPGSPAFLPPEAAKGDLTPHADVYALGCVAYWLLTANFVFRGATALEMMVGHVHVVPAPPSERTHQAIPAALERLVLDCLKKVPAERPDMKELGERLSACAAESPWTAADAEVWWSAHGEEFTTLSHEADAEVAWREGDRVRDVRAGVERLQQHFEKSHLDVGELERRIERVKAAERPFAIDAVFADLPAVASVAPAPAPDPLARVAPAPLARSHEPVINVMGAVERTFDLIPGSVVKAACVMGTLRLDFRGELGGPGVVVLRCVSVMGNIDIVVPRGVRVEIVSGGFMGSFEQRGRPSHNDPEKPVLRVIGVAVLGNVSIQAL